ncbi:ABC transporter permease [Methanosphaerula palustris]|uniref:NifC-like ABC-type porter n=1 Tax=Methanosphaerula palustris (strain ATCC BAA-1556 / DSM 19958 / E1-9c) TaxID=521011 RepID=B8GIT2_METPE|nr:ABC transporter permease [Methanosphaerula palustris]ACL16895.1 NifC-like ABC-type porter [Methanosphaerula palustris E1-9c]
MRRLFLSLTYLIFFGISAILLGLFLYSPLPALAASLASPEIRFAILLSLGTSVISTVICTAFAIPAAYALARYQFPGKRIATLALTLPLTLPPLVAGIALLLFFGTTPWGRALEDAGFGVIFTPLGIIVAEVFVNIPYMIRILRSAFAAVNPRYEYVAKTLGCTDAGAFLQVTLPMVRSGLLAGTVITWSKSMGEFGAVLMVAGATPMRTETLPIALYLNISTGDLNLAVAAATILILISIVTLCVVEFVDRGVHVY